MQKVADLNLVRLDLLQTDGQALLDEVNPVLLHVVSYLRGHLLIETPACAYPLATDFVISELNTYSTKSN